MQEPKHFDFQLGCGYNRGRVSGVWGRSCSFGFRVSGLDLYGRNEFWIGIEDGWRYCRGRVAFKARLHEVILPRLPIADCRLGSSSAITRVISVVCRSARLSVRLALTNPRLPAPGTWPLVS